MAKKDDVQEDQNEDVEVVEAQADEPETPVEEESTEDKPEVEEEQEQEDAEGETEEVEEEPEKPSRREQLRIQTLLKKYGDPRIERQAPSQEQLDYSQALDADPEVVKQLTEDRQQYGTAEYNRGQSESTQALQYTQFYNNIRFDMPLVKDKLSKLDPMDAKAIDDEYVAITGADPERGYVRNPDIGYADFVEARLEQAERLAKSMAAQSSKNIARQAAQTGLRPDGSVSKRLNLNKDPSDMSLEELYAVTGAAGPKK